jgi:hypothetical protein
LRSTPLRPLSQLTMGFEKIEEWYVLDFYP